MANKIDEYTYSARTKLYISTLGTFLGFAGVIYYISINKYPVAGFVGVLSLLLASWGVYIYNSNSSIKTCDPDIWKIKKDVLLPDSLQIPDYIDTNLCDAQKNVQYSGGTGFYYDGSNVYVIDEETPSLNIPPTNSNVKRYAFYYIKDKDIKPQIVQPTTTATTTTTPTANTTTTNDATCCFKNNNNECITFENTFVGGLLSREISDFFVNRAGKNFGSEVYIGDFTSRDLNGNTKILYRQSQLITTEPPNTNGTENIPESEFSWPVCVPQNIKNMNTKRIKNLLEEYKKTVRIDAWLMRSYIEHKIYIAKNGSPSSYFTVPGTPWRFPLQIKGTGLFDNDTVVKYNDEEFTTLLGITTNLRNKLITE